MGFVQTTTGTGGPPQVATIAFSSATTSGNCIVVAVADDSATTTEVTSVTDNKGNTYAALRSPLLSASAVTLSTFYALNITGGSGHIITAHLAGASFDATVTAQEFSSISTSGALDVTAGSTGSSTAAASGSTAATSQASEIIVGLAAYGVSGAASLGSGYTNLGNALQAGASSAEESKTVSATGTQSAAFTVPSGPWACVCATFKIQRGTPPTPAIPTFVNGTAYHAADVNALGSNVGNLWSYTMGGFRTYKPLCTVRILGSVTVTDNAYTTLLFDTNDLQTDGMFDSYLSAVNGYTGLVVRTAGVYRLSMQYTMPAGGFLTGLTEGHVCVNGQTMANAVSGCVIIGRASNSEATVGLSVGAQIYAVVYQHTGASVNSDSTWGGSYLTAEWLSP